MVDRRTVVVGAAVAVAAAGAVAACGSSDTAATDTAPTDAASTGQASAASTGADSTNSGALGKAADVPVGSGNIFGDVLVTQPTAGDFRGFSARCTHPGCKVSAISGETIGCPCHGSTFALDGSVTKGPAKRPLEAKSVRVQGTRSSSDRPMRAPLP